MGIVGSIIGSVCAAIAFVIIAYMAYCSYIARRNSPGSPKQAAAATNGTRARCPGSIICPLAAESDLERGIAIGVPTTSTGSSNTHATLTESSIGSNKAFSVVGQKSPRGLPAVKSKSYSFEEMRTATNHFGKKIGEGRFGPVYHGQLPAQEVAIKVIARNSGQGASEFVKEVDLVTNLHHGNLVSLDGHCQESPHQMLIYEYIPNGTLRDHLHHHNTQPLRPALTWQQRLHIALDAAEALEYLHNVHKKGLQVTIHGDMKPGNILLDNKLIAKVSDFGISKFASVDNSGVPAQVFGTPGYLDPEFATTKQLTVKSDIYSLGVVLLELMSGRPPIQLDSLGKPDSTWDLIEWARSLIRGGNMSQLVDPALGDAYEKHSMAKVAELVMFSVEPQGVNRPKACKIVEGLVEAIALEARFRAGTQSPKAVSSSTSRSALQVISGTNDGRSARMSTSARHSTAESEAMISFPSARCLQALEESHGPANIIIKVDTT